MAALGRSHVPFGIKTVGLVGHPWPRRGRVSLGGDRGWMAAGARRPDTLMEELSILCRPLLLLPPIPPSIRAFSNESTLCVRWPKYWSFSFSIIPSKEIPGLISFRMDWLDLLVEIHTNFIYSSINMAPMILSNLFYSPILSTQFLCKNLVNHCYITFISLVSDLSHLCF